MAATMDDLIATMGRGALVGQEGYDLRALQAHLAQTLYNPQSQQSPQPQQQSSYQPVAGTSTLPPAPVSSLNSHFSGSGSDEEQGNAVAGPSSGGGWDMNSGTWQKLAAAKRPQVTPMPSYYGASAGRDVEMDMGDDGGDMDMDEDNQDDSEGLAFETHGHTERERQRRIQRAAVGTSAEGGGLPSPPVDTDGTASESGYSAFESDAFAPLYNGGRAYGEDEVEGAQDGGDRTPVPGAGGNGLARTRSAGSGSGWEAFQKRPAGSPKGGWDRYGFNLQPVHQQGSAFGAQPTSSAFGHRSFSPSNSATSVDQASSALYPSFNLHASVSPPPIGLPTPPEEKALPRPLSTPNVQFGFSGMTPASGEAESPRKVKRRSGLDDADRRKWEGRLRSAGQQGARGGW